MAKFIDKFKKVPLLRQLLPLEQVALMFHQKKAH